MLSAFGIPGRGFRQAAAARIILAMTDQEHREREHFFGAAKVIASVTLLSRVLGLVRDIAITSLGAQRMTSAFRLAFQIPNLFRRLFGEGALSAAFVPVFSEKLETDGISAARKLLGNALGLLAALLAVLVILIEVGLLAWRMWAGSGEDLDLLLVLTAIMMPFTLTICLLALGSAALNCRGRFFFPAFAPVLLNIFIIVAAWGVSPWLAGSLQGRLWIIATAVPLAGVVQLAGVWVLLRRAGLPVRLELRPIQPGVRAIVRLAGPMLVGLGFIQLSELIYSLIAWVLAATADAPTLHLLWWSVTKPLQEGALVRIEVARRLYQFPMGVLAISLGVAVFPLLSRYASRSDMPNFRSSVSRAVRLAFMEGLAAGTGLFVLAGPITRMLFEHGRFTTADALQAAHILRFYAAGIWAICTYQIVARAFFALKDTITPLKVACASMVMGLAVVLATIWLPGVGAGAFGLGTIASAGVNTAVLLAILWKRVGELARRELLVSMARSAAASVAMAGALVGLLGVLHGRPPWLVVLATVPAGVATFLLAAWVLRMPEIGELVGAMRRRQAHDDQPQA